MPGKLFTAFLIVVVSAILFMLPVTDAIYDFRTDQRTDTYTTATAVAVTTANATLHAVLYDNDIGSASFISDLVTDIPLSSSYNSTSRQLLISGLTANTTRTMEITYDFNALSDSSGIDTLMDWMPLIWILIAIGFGPAALFSIFSGRGS